MAGLWERVKGVFDSREQEGQMDQNVITGGPPIGLIQTEATAVSKTPLEEALAVPRDPAWIKHDQRYQAEYNLDPAERGYEAVTTYLAGKVPMNASMADASKAVSEAREQINSGTVPSEIRQTVFFEINAAHEAGFNHALDSYASFHAQRLNALNQIRENTAEIDNSAVPELRKVTELGRDSGELLRASGRLDMETLEAFPASHKIANDPNLQLFYLAGMGQAVGAHTDQEQAQSFMQDVSNSFTTEMSKAKNEAVTKTLGERNVETSQSTGPVLSSEIIEVSRMLSAQQEEIKNQWRSELAEERAPWDIVDTHFEGREKALNAVISGLAERHPEALSVLPSIVEPEALRKELHIEVSRTIDMEEMQNQREHYQSMERGLSI